MIAELDCVALKVALPEHGLAAGDVGTRLGALVSLTVLVIALIALFLPWWASALIVFAVFAGLAALTGWTGYKKLDLRGPTRTMNSVKETVRWAKARLLGRSAS